MSSFRSTPIIDDSPQISGVAISGLKGFPPDQETRIDLRPMTLIFGPNNSGKSTILKSLANIAQTKAINETSVEKVDWCDRGMWFDLGGGEEVLHHGEGEGFTLHIYFKDPITHKNIVSDLGEWKISYTFALTQDNQQSFNLEHIEVWVNDVTAPDAPYTLESRWVKTQLRFGTMYELDTSASCDYSRLWFNSTEAFTVLFETHDIIESLEHLMDVEVGKGLLQTFWRGLLQTALELDRSDFEEKIKLLKQHPEKFGKAIEALGTAIEELETIKQRTPRPARRSGLLNQLTVKKMLLEMEQLKLAMSQDLRTVDTEVKRADLNSKAVHLEEQKNSLMSLAFSHTHFTDGTFILTLIAESVQDPRFFELLQEDPRTAPIAIHQDVVCNAIEAAMGLRAHYNDPLPLIQHGRLPKFSISSLVGDNQRRLGNGRVAMRLDNSFDALHRWIHNLEYQQATRLLPERIYSTNRSDMRSYAKAGAHTIVKLHRDQKHLDAVNAGLSEIVNAKLELNELFFKTENEKGEKRKEVKTGDVKARIRRNGESRSHDLPDVGFGISQLIPLLAGSFGPGALFVEEPESNLHPVAQAKVIERLYMTLAEQLKDEKNHRSPRLVMETHSEHILKRLLQLMETGEIDDDDICILYVWWDEETKQTKTRRIRTHEGRLIDEINTDFSNNPTMSLI